MNLKKKSKWTLRRLQKKWKAFAKYLEQCRKTELIQKDLVHKKIK